MAEWQSIVDEHASSVWRAAYRLLGNHADTADCVQEVFWAALQISRRQRVRNWRGLLIRLATCRALDALRRRCRQAGRHEDVADWMTVRSPNPGPVQQAQAAELSARLRMALAKLPAQQAEVFCLRWLNDLSYRQIARQLGLKSSAVGVLLHRARRRLRELLSPRNVSNEVEVLP